MSDSTTNDPRVLFAAERTFLAWIRTGLALMGFGFVVARFGIFLQQIMLDRGLEPARSSGFSVVLGVCLVAIGVAVFLASAWRYVLLVGAEAGRGVSNQAVDIGDRADVGVGGCWPADGVVPSLRARRGVVINSERTDYADTK